MKPADKEKNFFAVIVQKWVQWGEFVGHIMSSIILGLMFFTLITPLALYFRLIGRDPLRLKDFKQKKSYWIKRDTSIATMKRLF